MTAHLVAYPLCGQCLPEEAGSRLLVQLAAFLFQELRDAALVLGDGL